MNIALYFGSFNPIHNGHLYLGEYLTDNNLVDEVWYVVSPCNPLKKNSDLLDEHLRLKMVELAIRHNIRLKSCDIEFDMEIPSYTIDTLRKLSDKYKEHNFSIMIGSDNANVFHKWKDCDTILKDYKVFVYPRLGYDCKRTDMVLLDTPFYDISSTQIREDVVSNMGWLDRNVYDYIRENQLYSR